MPSGKTRITCHICGTFLQKENEKVGQFKVGLNKLKKWKEKVPNLVETSILCDHHFKEEDVIKGKMILGVFHPHKNWTLKSSAPPEILGI